MLSTGRKTEKVGTGGPMESPSMDNLGAAGRARAEASSEAVKDLDAALQSAGS